MRPRLVLCLLIAALALPSQVSAQEAGGPAHEDAPEVGAEPTATDGAAGAEGSTGGEGAGADGATPADEPDAPPASSRAVAVLLLAAEGVEAEVADDLTEVAIGSVAARGGVTIIGKEEFQARLGQGEARSLDCVTSAACVGRVGVQLGVDEVISGTLSHRANAWAFDLTRVDVRSGELLGRAFRELDGDLGAVAAAVQSAIPELYVERRPLSTLRITSEALRGPVRLDGEPVGELGDSELVLEGLSPGEHVVIVSGTRGDVTRRVRLDADATLQLSIEPPAAPEPDAVRISSLVWVGSGVALAGGAVALGFGLASRRQPTDGGTRAGAIAYFDDREREARIANIGLAGLAAGLGAAALGFVLSDFGARSTPLRLSVGVGPSALADGGLSLTIGGEL